MKTNRRPSTVAHTERSESLQEEQSALPEGGIMGQVQFIVSLDPEVLLCVFLLHFSLDYDWKKDPPLPLVAHLFC